MVCRLWLSKWYSAVKMRVICRLNSEQTRTKFYKRERNCMKVSHCMMCALDVPHQTRTMYWCGQQFAGELFWLSLNQFQVGGSPDQKPYFETKPRSRPCHIKQLFTHLFGKTRNCRGRKIFKFIISSRQLAVSTSSVLETLNNINQSRQKERSVIRSKLTI